MMTRRQFLHRTAAAGTTVGLTELGFISSLGPVSAEEAKLPVAKVQFDPEIEPLVRLLEDTPRDRVLEEFASRVRHGTTYREVLAALLLAGVRSIQPRPVGFKFHAVLVVNSAHLASLNSPDADRWLPIFWALDQFKSSQAKDVEEGDWTMAAVEESAVPAGHRAQEAFLEAMEHWDVSAADSAVAGLARTAPPQEIFEVFARLGARDFRDIGHKAIYVANSWRTLQNIGWQHAEPVLRSLTYALLEHEEGNPAERDAPADRPGRHNQSLVGQIRTDWLSGKRDANAGGAVLEMLRQANAAEAAQKTVELLNSGLSPRTIWDGVFAGAAELLVRQPGIVALHAMTSSNALHYAWDHSAQDETRRWLLLQATSFLTLFRDRIGAVPPARIDQLESSPAGQGDALAEIFGEISRNRSAAARKALGYLQAGGSPTDFIHTARRLIYLKGTDSHDYKFSEAALENYQQLAPELRRQFLAASVFNLRGSDIPDNPLIKRTRAAFGTAG